MRIDRIVTGGLVLALGTGLGFMEVLERGRGGAAPTPVLRGVRALAPPLPDAVPEAPPPEPEVLETLLGSASYYAGSLAGRRTASGRRYDPRTLVAAHRSLPFGTRLRVTDPASGRSVEVEVVDRGPFVRGRIVDLSRAAAERLGLIRRGHAPVRVEVLEYGGA